MMDLDGIFVLMPVTPMVPALAHEIERARVEAGLSVKEMLASLRDQRERYVREQYGSAHRWRQPSVFLDADVIFAGAATPTEHGASHVVLRWGEITQIECVTSTQAITEDERNLADKLTNKLPELRLIISRSLRIVPDPEPDDLAVYEGQADPKDLPILVAALKHGCRFLLTFNIRDYSPATDEIQVQSPGDFIATVRALLARLATATGR